MRKFIFVLVFTFAGNFLYTNTYAQSSKKAKKADNFYSYEEYLLALPLYKQLCKEEPKNLDYHLRTGRCILNLNRDAAEAIPYLQKVADSIGFERPKVLYQLGMAHFHAHNFSIAKLNFETALSLFKDDKESQTKINNMIQKVADAQELMKNEKVVRFVHLPVLNSRFDDFNPFVSSEESILVFSSNRDFPTVNIFFSKRESQTNKWQGVQKGGATINTNDDEIVAGLSKDGKQFFIHYSEYSTLNNVNYSVYDNNKFQEPENFGINVNSSFKEEGASISTGGDTLYFASNREGGFGGFDIYFSLKLPNGMWGKPQNMGEKINTVFDENYPNISDDGNLLYFSSKGHVGMGGYDIFSSKKNLQTGEWEQAENLGYPINDTYNNTNISIVNGERYGYISCIRPEGLGGLDIYKVIFEDVEAQYLIVVGKIRVGTPEKSVAMKDVDPNITITVYDEITGDFYGVYLYNKTTEKYVIALLPGIYTLEIEGDAYETYVHPFEIKEGVLTENKMQLDIFLQENKE